MSPLIVPGRDYRIPHRQPETIGPKAVVLTIPSSHVEALSPAKILIPVVKQAISLNTAPRAGQLWNVQSAYFNFPLAITQTYEAIAFKQFFPNEYLFEISLKFGTRTIAKQVFQTSSSSKNGEENRWPLVGNLEGFTDTTVYAGEGITLETKLVFVTYNEEKNSIGELADGQALTNKGEFVFNYTQRSAR